MTEHTPEAQAAYPDSDPYPPVIIGAMRTAFDRGRASMVETVTTVEELEALPEGSIVVSGLKTVSYIRRWDGWNASYGETVQAHLLLEPWHTNQPLSLVFRPDREEGKE